jgi:hypothetical protein
VFYPLSTPSKTSKPEFLPLALSECFRVVVTVGPE